MICISRSMALVLLLAFAAQGASGGTISGTVKAPSGAPLKGASVHARSATRSKITISVFSDKQGRYRIESLSPGAYQVSVTAVGYRSDPPASVTVAEGKPASLDFAPPKGMVLWSDLNNVQARALLPEGKGKDLFLDRCTGCHGFQVRIAAGARRDEAGWLRIINLMRTLSPPGPLALTDQQAADILSYLTAVFGPNSPLPPSPAELPQYQKVKRGEFSDAAMKIVFVDYELPGPKMGFAWNAAPDKDGNVWIPFHQNGNVIGRLDPLTGEVQEFRVPHPGVAGIHSSVAAPDGTVWLVEMHPHKIGKWDPRTRAITEYQNPGEGASNTVRIDPKGYIWVSGGPLVRFDPETKKFLSYPETMHTYGLALDQEGNPWFAEFRENGQIGKVDAKTGKVKKWSPPTQNARPRRIQVDREGIVWFGEFEAGKIGRFDPKTETFKEYQLPGPDPSPYALGIDRNNQIWYSSHNMSIIGRLDPKTGQISEYPSPYPDANNMREFLLDSQGRMWYGSGGNKKVGYFTLAAGSQ